ncbi:hypothetical protein ABDK56_12230 [Sphingomonas sp. ASV193]
MTNDLALTDLRAPRGAAIARGVMMMTIITSMTTRMRGAVG